MSGDLESLSIQFKTLFVSPRPGKIERENDPDNSPGPLFWLGGRSSANIFGVRASLKEKLGAQLTALAATEPPFFQKSVYPLHCQRYLTLLSDAGYKPSASLGLTYELPHKLEYETSIRVVGSESEEGKQLETRLASSGVPPELRELGFHTLEDFWKPWCVAFHEDRIASVACAARLSLSGAELGLTTVESLRGHGYGAAATWGWSQIPSLESRSLFYSADQTNASSQRVIARLGLRLLGAYLRLT